VNASDDPHPRCRVTVERTEISFVDTGHGEVVVFLHGNPTWSYLWRNIIPFVADRSRCLAPDLVGMGESGPAPNACYRFRDHARYLDAWFEAVLPHERVILVLHDWGSALGFDWAFRHQRRVEGIAYMEAIVRPRRWDDLPEDRRDLFRRLRTDEGEQLALDENFFVETLLPRSIIRTLSDEEMEHYRRPFPDRESRLPTLVWAQELPIDGAPADVVETVEQYGAWLAQTTVPKLFVSAEPGSLLIGRAREFCRDWLNQREVSVHGIHYLQEDAPSEIGSALRDFINALRS
jgi:haloalkane dehalogenase